MTITLRDDQQPVKNDIYTRWNEGHRNVLTVMPTGAGKTVTFSSVIADHPGRATAIAHRKELVGQISMTLARFGIKHAVLGPKNIITWLTRMHYDEFGREFISQNALTTVAGVDTIKSRLGTLTQWAAQQTLWVQDEAHHILVRNKWGAVAAAMPNARGLGVTATPVRADGAGLGRHADGLFDVMVEGPTMRELIEMGNLTDYRIFAPPSDLDLSHVSTSKATGDYSKPQLVAEVKKSHITGDVVEHYIRIAYGKLGVAFATDVETAANIASQFINAGVAAAVVSAKTPDKERSEILRKFANREIWVLVNVDLFGEGFDLPSLEVVMMARPTQSFGLYAQQFGRALRPMEGKTHAIIIDHVGNVVRHGLPDAPKTWTLDRRERKSKKERDPNDIPVTSCIQCTAVYQRIHKACPFCGHVPIPAERSAPEFVDGDLYELDPAALAALRGEVDRIDLPHGEIGRRLAHAGAPQMAILGAEKNHRLRQEAQQPLRDAIAWWAGYHQARGRDDSESQRRFFHQYGIDVMTAQALGKADADKLTGKIHATLDKWGLTLDT